MFLSQSINGLNFIIAYLIFMQSSVPLTWNVDLSRWKECYCREKYLGPMTSAHDRLWRSRSGGWPQISGANPRIQETVTQVQTHKSSTISR